MKVFQVIPSSVNDGTLVEKVLPSANAGRVRQHVHRRCAVHILCSVATFSILFLPMMHAISISASTSSFEFIKGNFSVRKKQRIMPAAQTSMATQVIRNGAHRAATDVPPVWSPHLRSTSGARNPLVPARLAREWGLSPVAPSTSSETEIQVIPTADLSPGIPPGQS